MTDGRLDQASIAAFRRAAAAGEVEVVASLWNLFETAKSKALVSNEAKRAKLRVADTMDSFHVRRLLRTQNELLVHDFAQAFAALTNRRYIGPDPFRPATDTIRQLVEDLVRRRSAEMPARLRDLRGLHRDGPHAASLGMLFGRIDARARLARLGRGPRRWRVLARAADIVGALVPNAAVVGMFAGALAVRMHPFVEPPPTPTEVARRFDDLHEAARVNTFMRVYSEMVESDEMRTPHENDAVDEAHAFAANYVDFIIHEGFAANQLAKTIRRLRVPVRVYKVSEWSQAVRAILARTETS